MASKKGSQLPVASSVADNDSVIIVTATSPTTKRSPKSVLLQGLASITDLVAGLADKADLTSLTSHTSDTFNPHGTTKDQVGLSNIDDTADSDKPISTAAQTALAAKAYKTTLTVGPSGSQADYVCDGTADNVQIQAAIDAANTAGGGEVVLLQGQFNLTSSILMKSAVNLRGVSRSGTILRVASDLNASVVSIAGASNFTLKSLTINGNNALVAPTFGDNTRNGMGISGTCENVIVENVTCVDTSGNGIFSSPFAVTNNIVIRDCETKGTGTRGLYVQSDNVKVFGGYFHHSVLHDGIQFENCNDCYVFGAHAYSNAVKGFECQVGATNIQFINCQSYSNGAEGGEVANGCKFVDFVNCHIHDNASSGVVYQQESGNICSDSIIMGNTLYNNGTSSGFSGITISGCSRINILNNVISYSAKHGVLLQSGGIGTVTGTYDCVVTDNTCYNNGVLSTTGDGIALFTDTQRNIIESNFCFDDRGTKKQRYGVNISASTCIDNIVRSNKVSRNLTGGVNDAGTNTVRDNQYSEDPGDGKWLASYTNTKTSGSVYGFRVKTNFDSDAGNNDQLMTIEGATKRWLRIDGNGRLTSEGSLSLGHTTNPSSTLDVVGGSALLPVPAAAISDANTEASQYSLYLDEINHSLNVKWKESGGGVYSKIIHTQGPLTTALSTKTTTYTITEKDSVILANATSAAFQITLPTAVGITGRQYTIKRINSAANNVTVGTASSQTIDGATTKTLGTQWAFVTVVSDGANWVIVSQGGTVS